MTKPKIRTAMRNPLRIMMRKNVAPGARPGIEHLPEASAPPPEDTISASCLDYGPGLHQRTEIEDLEVFLTQERPAGSSVRWINVNGLHAYSINQLHQAFSFHALVAEDVLHANQRPKVEAYEGHLFIVCQMLMESGGRPMAEQVSFILFEDLLITFQERPGDVWDRVRARIISTESRLRRSSTGYLIYALLDALVDNMFPLLEHYGNTLDEIEGKVLGQPSPEELRSLYLVKQQLVLLRRVIWPMRQMVDDLHRTERREIDKKSRTYLRDVYDHSIQVMEIVEAYRETANSLTDLYMSSVANRMNEVMKVLTIMASLFIPVTFLAGVYGMNFESIPELSWRWSYPVFWGICVLSTGGLLFYFRHKGWLGSSDRAEDPS